MLFIFGREVERFIGRRAYIVLYLLLLLMPAVLLMLWDFGARRNSGSPVLHFAIFVPS